MRHERRVIVYDPDGVNPYGREIACLLAERDLDVHMVLPRDVEWVPDDIVPHALLPSNHGRSTPRAQLAALLKSMAWCAGHGMLRRKDVWVVPWTRAWSDELMFTFLAVMRRRVIVVFHNPGPRRERGWRLRTARLLRRHALACVVHSELLAAVAMEQEPRLRTAVCPHPPYARWWQVYAQRRMHDDQTFRLLVVGQLRPDKGLEALPAIIDDLPDDVRARSELVLCGKGSLPTSLDEQLRGLVTVRTVGGNAFVPDAELAAELASCDVMVAPYRAVTQSGSIVMALTADLPVAAFDAGSLRDVVQPSGLVPLGDARAFAHVLVAAAAGGHPGQPNEKVTVWRARSQDAWQRVVCDEAGTAKP